MQNILYKRNIHESIYDGNPNIHSELSLRCPTLKFYTTYVSWKYNFRSVNKDVWIKQIKLSKATHHSPTVLLNLVSLYRRYSTY